MRVARDTVAVPLTIGLGAWAFAFFLHCRCSLAVFLADTLNPAPLQYAPDSRTAMILSGF